MTDISDINIVRLAALLAERGLELVIRPAAPSAAGVAVARNAANQTSSSTQSVSQPAVQVQAVVQQTGQPESSAEPVPDPPTNSATRSTTSTKSASATSSVVDPPVRPAAKSQPLRRSPTAYSPYQRSPRNSLINPSQNGQSKYARPPIKLRYMKKPKGTPGRKGKAGWPEPMRSIWGTTADEYRFMYNTAKRLVYKKLDTSKCLRDQDEDLIDWVVEKFYELIPEFVEVYGGSRWPAMAFIQVALKAAVEAHKRMIKGISPIGSDSGIPIPQGDDFMDEDDMDEDSMLEVASTIVDGGSGEDELGLEFDAYTTMISTDL